MFRVEDITTIQTNLNDLSRKSDEIRLDKYEPTLNELENIYQEIANYARKNKLIIYGGWAQNVLIKQKDEKDAFYDRYSLADFEFYSPEPIKIGMDLANHLYKLGHKYIQLSEGVHNETYKLFVNFHNF